MRIEGHLAAGPDPDSRTDWATVTVSGGHRGAVLGTAVTDAIGRFRLAVPIVAPATLAFQVSIADELVEIESPTVVSAKGGLRADLVLAVRARGSGGLAVRSLAELRSREDEILARLSRLKDGGRLFLLDPFRAMASAGVELDSTARSEFSEAFPWAARSTAHAFRAAAAAGTGARVSLKGIFRSGRSEAGRGDRA